MGLDASVGDFESDEEYIHEHMGSYSGYHRWRKAIAKAKGFDLNEMDGYAENKGESKKWTDEPFQLIFNHSDCDGEYTLDQIPELLKEVQEIKKLGVDDYEQSDKFIRLCKAALKYKRPIEFH